MVLGYYIMIIINTIRKIYLLYHDGFRNMKEGRKLWIIILLKLVIIFFVLKFFFFPDFLKSKFSTEKDRSNWVIHELTNTK